MNVFFDQNQNLLLYIVESGSLTIKNCYINHFISNITTYSEKRPIFSPSLLITKTNYFKHDNYNTYYCSPFKIIQNLTISNSFNPNNYLNFFLKIISYLLIFLILLIINIILIIFLQKKINEKNQFEEFS